MNPIPLSEKYLEQTIKLASEIFPDNVEKIWNPDRSFTFSLRQDPGPDEWRNQNRPRYWIIVNNEDEVVGVTGLYRMEGDPSDVVWLGWYCVRPDQRGKGVGRKLLEWTIEKARSEGFKKLKLYTSTSPNEARAQELYEKLGFKLVGEEQEEENNYKTLYREKVL
jgi:putative acetyltransferase